MRIRKTFQGVLVLLLITAGTAFAQEPLPAPPPLEPTEAAPAALQSEARFLDGILKSAFPDANLNVVAAAFRDGEKVSGTLIVEGNVLSSKDQEAVMKVARALLRGNPTAPGLVNALKVGATVQVEIHVVMARIARSELANIFGNPKGESQLAPNLIPNVVANSETERILKAIQESRPKARLISESHLVTLLGRPAKYLSGGDQAVPDQGPDGSTIVRYVPFGTIIEATPIMLASGKLRLEIEAEQSSLDADGGVTVPGIGLVAGRTTSRIHTSGSLDIGETLVVGGGSLSKPEEGSEEEMIVLVTPHLVHPPAEEKSAVDSKPGMETHEPVDSEFLLEPIQEAPRGQREICPNRKYVPATKTMPATKSQDEK